MSDTGKVLLKKKKNGSGKGNLLNIPYSVWAVAFIIIPMFIIAYYAFTDSDGGFTFENLEKLPLYKDIIIDSFFYALIATIITFLLAYPFAYFVTKCSETTQKIIMMLVMIPLWMNLLILTYSIMMIIEREGLINNLLDNLGFDKVTIMGTPGAVILGMIYSYFPYMVLPLVSVMSKIDNSLLEASADLGSNSVSRFFRIIFPLSLPGIISGATMVFVPSVSTFYIAQVLGQNGVNMIGDKIDELLHMDGGRGQGALLALILMVVILIILVCVNRFSDSDEGGMVI